MAPCPGKLGTRVISGRHAVKVAGDMGELRIRDRQIGAGGTAAGSWCPPDMVRHSRIS